MIERHNCNPEKWHPPMVVVVGVGMGKSDLGASALAWISRAEVLAGGRRILDMFSEHPGQKIELQSPIDKSITRIKGLSLDSRLAVLASGDPFFFGIGRRLVECFGKENIVAIPNVTAVQALFARMGEPWDGVKVMSLHGRGDSLLPVFLREIRCNSRLAVLTDPHHTPNWIAQQLLNAGMEDRTMTVAEDLGSNTEAICRLPVEEVIKQRFSPLNIVAIIARNQLEAASHSANPKTIFGFPEEQFHHRAGLITKLEIRAVVLAHLRLEADLVLWDLGAGSGSVSIEASRIAPLRRVIAVEWNDARFLELQENIREFGCFEIEAIQGKASEVIDRLPDPDRVFIGGSGEDLDTILYQVARRLRPRGRVVQTAVTLETLEKVRSFWQENHFEIAVTQVQINRSSPIGRRLRFEAVNPVFVVTIWQ